MIRRVILLVIIGLVMSSTGANAYYQWPKEYRDREILVGNIKTYSENSMGFESTGSYTEYSEEGETFTLCYIAPLFQVVDRVTAPSNTYKAQDNCNEFDTSIWDGASRIAKGYASPGSDSAMNPILVASRVDNFIGTVIHEEFHDQTWGFLYGSRKNMKIAEGTAALIGLAGAQEFACNFYGDASDECSDANRAFIGYVEFSKNISDLADELRELYAEVNNGIIPEERGLVMKQELFQSFVDDRNAMREDSGKTGTWEGIYSNAALGDFLTYTTHIPLLYDLYVSFDEDVGETSKYLINLSEDAQDLRLGEEHLVSIIQEKIQELQEGS